MVKRKPKAEVLDDTTLHLENPNLVGTGEELTDLLEFLRANVGNDCVKEFRRRLKKSAGTTRVVNALIDQAYSLIEGRPDGVAWLKTIVSAITAELMEPRKRAAEALFFPSATSEARVVDYLDMSQKTMEICLFTITSDTLANAVRRAHDRGVAVRIITDDENLKMLGSDVRALAEYGIPFKNDPDPHAHMHHKFVVIDDSLLLTGSFNWTKQAAFKNQENLAVIDDSELVVLYKQEFEKLWAVFGTAPPLPAPVQVPEASDPVLEDPVPVQEEESKDLA